MMTKKRFAKAGVLFEEVDLDSTPERIDDIKKLGYTSLPVVISGGYSWCGFLPKNIDLTARHYNGIIP